MSEWHSGGDGVSTNWGDAIRYNPDKKDQCFFQCVSYCLYDDGGRFNDIRRLLAGLWGDCQEELQTVASVEGIPGHQYRQEFRKRMWGGRPELQIVAAHFQLCFKVFDENFRIKYIVGSQHKEVDYLGLTHDHYVVLNEPESYSRRKAAQSHVTTPLDPYDSMMDTVNDYCIHMLGRMLTSKVYGMTTTSWSACNQRYAAGGKVGKSMSPWLEKEEEISWCGIQIRGQTRTSQGRTCRKNRPRRDDRPPLPCRCKVPQAAPPFDDQPPARMAPSAPLSSSSPRTTSTRRSSSPRHG